jgi:hypothetical protein
LIPDLLPLIKLNAVAEILIHLPVLQMLQAEARLLLLTNGSLALMVVLHGQILQAQLFQHMIHHHQLLKQQCIAALQLELKAMVHRPPV